MNPPDKPQRKRLIERIRGLGNKSPAQLDREFKEAYQNILLGQYRGLSMEPAEVKKDADLIVSSPQPLEWEDLYRLELDIVKLEPFAALKRRAWVLRNEFAEVASAEEVKDYYGSNPPDPETASEMALRVDCARIQEELNWRYIVLSVLEEFRSSLTNRVVRISIYFLAFSLLVLPVIGKIVGLLLPTAHEFLPPLNFILLALIVVPGIVGGLVSTLQRIQSTTFGGNADLVLTQFEKGSSGIVLSPFFGGIFSFIFFCLMAGGFLSGNLFPKIGFENLLPDTVSAPDFGEYAKLVVWCFISGFSERFVPDQLDVFAKGVSSGEGASVPRALPPATPAKGKAGAAPEVEAPVGK